jgi:hypothetical protein
MIYARRSAISGRKKTIRSTKMIPKANMMRFCLLIIVFIAYAPQLIKSGQGNTAIYSLTYENRLW